MDLKTIHNWADKGEIRHFRTPGRHLRFRRLDVLDFLRKYGYPIPDVLRMGKPKVVVVDDDPAALATLRRRSRERFDLTTFQDPFDALVAVGNLQPDALVLDVKMPGLDGVRCLERLAVDRRDVAHPLHRLLDARRDEEERDRGRRLRLHQEGRSRELRDSLERLMGLERG